MVEITVMTGVANDVPIVASPQDFPEAIGKAVTMLCTYSISPPGADT